MAKNNSGLLIAGGAAALLLMSSKKKKKQSGQRADFVEGDDLIAVDESALPTPGPGEVAFSLDFQKYSIAATWRVRVLDNWLNERRKAGHLATMDHEAGWFYDLMIGDPIAWLGDLTGTGKVGGTVIYSGLWLMGAIGIGIYWAGFAGVGLGSSGAAAISGSQATKAAAYIRHAAKGASTKLTRKGYAGTKAEMLFRHTSGISHLNEVSKAYGVGKSVSLISGGAAQAGKVAVFGSLAEAGIDEAFGPDLAASATQAAAEFSATHTVKVAGEDIPIAILPSGDDYPAVQDFNKFLMNYIMGFQKRHF